MPKGTFFYSILQDCFYQSWNLINKGEKMETYQVVAIIPAAGIGQRMHAGTNKIWLQLGGRSILEHITILFQNLTFINHIVLAVNPDEIKEVKDFIRKNQDLDSAKFSLVLGGAERQNSVENCLSFLQNWLGWETHQRLALVHDAARVLIAPELIHIAIEQCLIYNAVGIAVPVKDTIKQIDSEGFVSKTLDRSTLYAMQTPQVFDFNLLCDCYRQVAALDRKFTDDCSIVEHCGYQVKLVKGSYENFKITTPEDLIMADTILRRRQSASRTGI
ncbi:MAG TPA: 2-C-methyl-D-erythritol 4-phosphate cytidylyltransferase [Firmicutes bacterium]|nr:2-C-methyl-D-erythritol 4-phosphate cytidylyltransferase [Bacillota bacterium]